MSTEKLDPKAQTSPLKLPNGEPRLRADGSAYEQKDMLQLVKDLIAQKVRLADKKPKIGDLVNETNYDLKSIANYMKTHKRASKEEKKFCAYELKKIKEDQINFTKKVFGIFTSMMVVTLIPVLKVAFTKSDATTAAGSPDDEPAGNDEPAADEEPNYTSWFLALGTAFFSAMLLACMFFPCTARPSARKYVNKVFPVNYILLYVFSLSVSFLLCKKTE